MMIAGADTAFDSVHGYSTNPSTLSSDISRNKTRAVSSLIGAALGRRVAMRRILTQLSMRMIGLLAASAYCTGAGHRAGKACLLHPVRGNAAVHDAEHFAHDCWSMSP
jgi:hypothetical protein